MRFSRRSVLRTGALLSVGLAGCFGSDDEPSDSPCVAVEPNYRNWFDDVSNYRCTVDERGADSVTIMVGVQGNSGYYKFGPPAVAVSPGTTVNWEWIGRGGTHNVVSRNGLFDSGSPVDKKGHTYERTFDAPGVFYYLCEPHVSLGMKGAIFVALGE